ncbi:MAG: hypothetical protein AAGI68_06135 [Planctomycetota bacterium]
MQKKRPGRAVDRNKTTGNKAAVRKKNAARLRSGRPGRSGGSASVKPSGVADGVADAVRVTEPLDPARVVAAEDASGVALEDEALAKLAEYRPMVIDLLLAMGMGTNGEPLELRRRVLTDLAKLGLRLPPAVAKREVSPEEESGGLEQRLVEHFERYQRVLSSGD